MPVDAKRVSRDTLYIALVSTVTILAWIGFEVIRSLTKSEVKSVTRQQLEPLPAGLNQTAIQLLKQRVVIDASKTQNLPVPTNAPAVTESAKSVSIEVTPTPAVATGAGVLP